MARKERKKNTENDKLLSSGKILPEVRQKMVKGEGVDVIIGKV